MKRYILYSALSGCVWAAMAFVLSYWAMGEIIFGAIAVSPLIGIFVGIVYLPAYKLSNGWQVFFSLVTLYLAVALFGLSAGLYDAFGRDIPNRNLTAVVIQAVLATLWGITFLGCAIFLWPLSYFNHHILRRAAGAA